LITIEDKLGLFTKLVVDQLQGEYNKRVAELERENELRLREFRIEAKEKSEEFYYTYIKNAQGERKKRLSSARSDRKKNRLIKQQALIEELMEGVLNKGRTFVKTPEYEGFLKRLVDNAQERIKEYEAFTVYVTEKDFDEHKGYIEELLAEIGVEPRRFKIKTTTWDIVGGIMVVHKKKIRQLDLSIRTRIEEDKNCIGSLVFKMLKEAGGRNE